MEKNYLSFRNPVVSNIWFCKFLKNNEIQKIYYYSEIIKKINKSWAISKVKDRRGIAYEQIGEWENAEEIFWLLQVKPDQAYVINYLHIVG